MVRGRPVLEVELAGLGSLVRGPGSRALLVKVTGHPPVWLSRRHGWACRQATAVDVAALAERRHFVVVILDGPTHEQRKPGEAHPTSEPEPVPEPDGQAGLW